MSPAEVIEIGRESVITTIMIAGPIMIVALSVGLAIALFQALTQMQEMTLSFVPKILLMLVALIALLPFMLNTLIDFTQILFDRMIGLGT